jgi:hypothetical protein
MPARRALVTCACSWNRLRIYLRSLAGRQNARLYLSRYRRLRGTGATELPRRANDPRFGAMILGSSVRIRTKDSLVAFHSLADRSVPAAALVSHFTHPPLRVPLTRKKTKFPILCLDEKLKYRRIEDCKFNNCNRKARVVIKLGSALLSTKSRLRDLRLASRRGEGAGVLGTLS